MYYRFTDSDGEFSTGLNATSLEDAKQEFISLKHYEMETKELFLVREMTPTDFFNNIGVTYETSPVPFKEEWEAEEQF